MHRMKLLRRLVWGVVAVGFLSQCGRSAPFEEPTGIEASTIWVDKGVDADVGQFNSLATDSRGSPRVSYYDFSKGDLKYAKLRSDGRWDIEVVDEDGDVGLYSSLAIDSEDNPHIVYYDKTNDALKYAYFNGTEWRRAVIFADHGGLFASLALDKNDVAHISFVDRGLFDLYYITWDAIRRGGQVPDAYILDTGTITGPSGLGGNINGGTSIKVRTESQFPIVAYYHASLGALMVMYRDPNSPNAGRGDVPDGWVQDIVEGGDIVGADANDVGEHASLFVAGERDWHISYYDKTNENLKYAHWNEEAQRWETEMVDDEGLVGESSSITVVCKRRPGSRQRDCRPYISYFDSTNNDLKVATRGQRGWQTFRADLAGMTGMDTSIAEVSGGRVGISYRDFTYSGLKFLLFKPF